MKTIINVTQEDIDKANHDLAHGISAYRSTLCPIAQACKHKIEDFLGVQHAVIRRQYNDNIKLPIEATNFIIDFDLNKPVKPFTFEIEYQP